MRYILQVVICFLTALSFIGCDGSFTKEVKLKEDKKALLDEAKAYYNIEEIELLGTKHSDGENLLTINLINFANPPDDQQLGALLSKFAFGINDALEQPNEYPLIKVALVKRTGNAINNASTSKGFIYDIRERKR